MGFNKLVEVQLQACDFGGGWFLVLVRRSS